jgi:hypothetical protein
MELFGSLSPAAQRTRDMLFRPFSLGKWFALGFVFFLQGLIEGTGGNRLNLNTGSRGGGAGTGPGAPPSVVSLLQELRRFVEENHLSLGILIATGVLVGLVAIVGLTWLGTRGQMMAIRNVAKGEASVADAWREAADPAFALFKLRLGVALLSLAITGPLLGLAIVRTYALIDDGVTDDEALLVGLVPFAVLFVAIAFVFGAFDALVRNFVAPLMWRFGLGVRDAFARFRVLASGRWLLVLGFLLLRFVATLVVGLLDSVLVTCTCCLGGLPILHTTLLAPWLVFERAWSLYFIQSAGADWRMVDEIPEPHVGWPPAPPPPGYYGGGYGPPPGFPGY